MHHHLSAGEKRGVGLYELLMGAELDRTPFIVKAFHAFDTDNDSNLDFREFTFALWNFLTLDRGGLALFLFDLYDRDDSGYMNRKELESMLKDALGAEAVAAGPSKHMVERIIHKSKGNISRADFMVLSMS